MAVKKILTHPEYAHILKQKSVAVRAGEAGLPELIQDLRDTLLATPHAVGLAAPQIGVTKRVFVLRKDYLLKDLQEQSRFRASPDKVMTFLNAKIISRKGAVTDDEGCLSIPGAYLKLVRAEMVKVRALSERYEDFTEKFTRLAARAVQQEIDHLDGVLIIDRK
ncbi:MAG: peptide deformylase [Candidatus Omnitrophica bacterium]|nr:peptide deformylase [Candidatus Omnitrophota bacterium]